MNRLFNDLKEDETSYRFSYVSGHGDREIEMRINLDEFETWHEVMLQFAGFLSSVYGYDIRDKIDFID